MKDRQQRNALRRVVASVAVDDCTVTIFPHAWTLRNKFSQHYTFIVRPPRHLREALRYPLNPFLVRSGRQLPSMSRSTSGDAAFEQPQRS
jgi:hypothetical protein